MIMKFDVVYVWVYMFCSNLKSVQSRMVLRKVRILTLRSNILEFLVRNVEIGTE